MSNYEVVRLCEEYELCPHAFGNTLWVVVVVDLTRCWVPVVCSNDTRA